MGRNIEFFGRREYTYLTCAGLSIIQKQASGAWDIGDAMKKWIRRIIMILLVTIFIGSTTYVLVTYHQYRENDRRYTEMAEGFTEMTDAGGPSVQVTAPITVDFSGLKEVNEDIIGWLYCEGTAINYPVLQGEDNDQYLRSSYDGSYNAAGSIFVEASNRENFQDSNTIIYGHHMKNGSMFAALDKWADQEFYEAHPVMWLLTPDQDYRIDLFSGYTTSAYSQTYTIFTGPGKELDDYLVKCAEQSNFQADVELDGQARYVLLSTCAYVFDDARNVLHGRLVPVDSAGGLLSDD